MPERSILFVPVHAPSMLEMAPIAERIVADGKYAAIALLDRRSEYDDDRVRELEEAGIQTIDPQTLGEQQGGDTPSGGRQGRPAFRAWPRLGRFVDRLLLRTRWRLATRIVAYRRMIREADALLRRESVSALALLGDRHLGWETALVRAANGLSIPSLIVPYAISVPEAAARQRMVQENGGKYNADRLLNRIAAALFPRWAYEYRGKRLLFYPADMMIPGWIAGIAPRNPWTIGGGDSTRTAAESQRLRGMLAEQGAPESKIVVTGKPSVDQMSNAMSQAHPETVREELGVSASARVLLCAVPQLGEHKLLPWPEHWQEVEFLLSTFARLPDVSVVLSLHPKSDPEAYRPWAEKYGAVIASRRVYELLPACDVFAATFSSTIMQAVGVGKPAVVVDLYGLGYTFYDDAPGVTVVRDRERLEPELARLFTDRDYYDRQSEAQCAEADRWVLLDGKCTERIVDELYGLIENPPAASMEATR